MRFSCQSCQAKYSIPDERVEGKVIRLKCQKCQAEIVVRGPAKPTQAEARTEIAPAPPVKPKDKPKEPAKPLVARVEDRPAVRLDDEDAFGGGDEDEDEPRESTRIANLTEIEGMRRQALAEAAQLKGQPAKKAAPPPAAEAPIGEWLVLIGGKQQGPLTAAQILEKIHNGEIHARSYIWKEGMREWQRASQLPPFDAAFPEPAKPAAPEKKPKEDFDAIFGPRGVPPPLENKPVEVDPEPPSQPHDLEHELGPILDPSPELREPTMLMTAAPPPAAPKKRGRNIVIIAGVLTVVVILCVIILDLLGVIALSHEESAASQPTTAPDALSEDEKARLREGLLGKKELRVEGQGLAKDAVQKVIDDNQAALKACADKRIEKQEGRVDVTFTVDPNGAVTDANAKNKDADLCACVTQTVRGWKFPQFSGAPVVVEYPFILSQGS